MAHSGREKVISKHRLGGRFPFGTEDKKNHRTNQVGWGPWPPPGG